jgi:hypothetical protein
MIELPIILALWACLFAWILFFNPMDTHWNTAFFLVLGFTIGALLL